MHNEIIQIEQNINTITIDRKAVPKKLSEFNEFSEFIDFEDLKSNITSEKFRILTYVL